MQLLGSIPLFSCFYGAYVRNGTLLRASDDSIIFEMAVIKMDDLQPCDKNDKTGIRETIRHRSFKLDYGMPD